VTNDTASTTTTTSRLHGNCENPTDNAY